MPDTVCPNCSEVVSDDSEACPACGQLFIGRMCDLHPDRPAIGQCVVCGRALCEECNQPQGRHFVCEEHALIPLIEGWAQVYSAADDVEAELIRENLAAEGIDSRVYSQKDHFAFSVEVGELSQVRVLVPAFAYVDAVAEIRSHTDAAGEVAFACPNCGEAYEPGETRCSRCGAPLPPTVRRSPA